jgi:hypothetical protein
MCGCYLSQGITLASSQAVSNARKLEWPLSKVAEGIFETEAPGGYKFYLQDRSPSQSGNYNRPGKACLKAHLIKMGWRGFCRGIFCITAFYIDRMYLSQASVLACILGNYSLLCTLDICYILVPSYRESTLVLFYR